MSLRAASSKRTRRQAKGRKPKRFVLRQRHSRSVRSKSAPVLVIGVGNLARGDDGVGLLVARKLRACVKKLFGVPASAGLEGRSTLTRKFHTRLGLPTACSRNLQVAIPGQTLAARRKLKFAATACEISGLKRGHQARVAAHARSSTHALRGAKLRRTKIVEATGESAGLMELWRGAEDVILVDAVQSGAKPGTIHRLDARTERVPIQFFHCSTHAFGVAEAVELGRLLGQLPPRLVIFGVEGRHFSVGQRLSPAVAASVEEAARRIRCDIENVPLAARTQGAGHSVAATKGRPKTNH